MGIYLEERKEIKDLKLLQSPYIQEVFLFKEET